MKILLTILMLSTLTSCSLWERRIVTDTVTQNIPVITVPKPPRLYRPDLAIRELTNADAGAYPLIVQSYKVSIIQLLNYIEQLELVYDEYDNLADETR